jgi:hypothetical protein
MNLIKQLAIFAYRVWPITLIVVLGLSAVVIGPQPAKVADPVPDMSREAQCKTSKHYTRVIAYDGVPIIRDTIQCFNNLVIRSEKL